MTPLFISYFTPNGLYPVQAKRLVRSFDKHRLDYEVDELKPFSSWVEANAYRVPFIASKLRQHQRPVIWIDCDCEIVKYPKLLMENSDFSMINWHAIRGHHLDGKIDYDPQSRKAIFSGGISKWTMAAMPLLVAWGKFVQQNRSIPEDKVLSWVWNNMPAFSQELNFSWLPASYLSGLFLIREVEAVIKTEYKSYSGVAQREKMWRSENERSVITGSEEYRVVDLAPIG